MKIKAARFSNFAKFEKFECQFAETVTHLVGANGAGKTTVGLKGLIACINGISEQSGKGALIGERFRFIGKAGKSADIAYQFVDETTGATFWIKNHVTTSGNNITFKSDGDTPINDSWLKGFLNVALMSAKNFCTLSGRDQAVALGIDTASFDAEIKKIKDEFTLLNRDLKNYGEIPSVQKAELVDIANLLSKKQQISDKIKAQWRANKEKNDNLRDEYLAAVQAEKDQFDLHEKDQAVRQEKIDRAEYLRDELKNIGYSGAEVDLFVCSMPKPEIVKYQSTIETPLYVPEIPDDAELRAIEAEIVEANKSNLLARDYRDYLIRFNSKEAKKKEIEENKIKLAEATRQRNTYISSFSFPFAGLATDETGCLMLNDRPITSEYFSKGELEIIVAKLHASINPDFKCRFIDDFDLLDEANQEKILADLLAAGFQVITAEVGNKTGKENEIVLRECKILTDEEEKESLI